MVLGGVRKAAVCSGVIGKGGCGFRRSKEGCSCLSLVRKGGCGF